MSKQTKRFLLRLLCLIIVFSYCFISILLPYFEAEQFTNDLELTLYSERQDPFLGDAGNFDLFAIGDVKNLTHVEGAVAIGGNYENNSNGLSMATNIQNNPNVSDKITLLIGKFLNANNSVMSCCAGYIG